MDDWRLIETNNPLADGQFTPFNIWFQTDFTLSSLALRWQYLAWGHAPGWYHAVNLLLHATSAVLVWRLLAALKIPGAWLAAALFAVHPVCVNSVARIAEIKNTLSLPFFLLGFWAYLRYEAMALYPAANVAKHPHSRRSWATVWYTGALLAFIAALLAKTSTVMLPLLLVAAAAWQRRRINRQDWLHTAPFFVLALAFGLMSVWYQNNQALFSEGETLAPQSLWQRFAISGHILAFYLGKAFLPINLSVTYPRWNLTATHVATYLPHLALGVGAIVCWCFRRTWGRHVLFAIGCYAIALFPALGFFNSQFLVLWQVSDHLQYLPLIAPLALAASCLAAIGGRQPETNTCHFEQKVIKATKIHPVLRFLRSLLYTSWSGAGGGPAFLCVTVILLAGLSILTFQRAAVFASGEKLTRDSIAKNPQDWYSRNELGTLLARRNDLPDALEQFQAAFRLQPDNAKVNSNLAHALALSGKTQEAEARYRASLALDPTSDDTRKNFADLLRREGRQREAILQYESGLAIKPDSTTRLNLAQLYYQEGEVDPAQREFREVLKHEPDNINALNNFAWLLATCGDDSQRNGSEAVQFAEKACALTQFKQARLTGTLAAAYAEAGRFAEAVDVGRKTVQLASESGDQQTAAMANQLLELYLSKRPFHQPVPQSRQP